MDCKQCSSSFEITDSDRQFYDSVSPVIADKKYPLPEPTLCSQCRSQRRMVWRAELNLFKRKSDFSEKAIVSFYPPEADCKVYTINEWWSDDWDPIKYGRDFDFSRPFSEQFAELVKKVPLMGLSCSGNENSDYINCASWNKNCYLIAGANYNEDCYYGNFINHCKNCIDNCFIDHCELCYECIDSKDCYNLKYAFNCHNCSDSYFLYSCRNCRNCFGSVNLVGKEYMFMNEQLTKEKYEERISKLQLDKRNRISEAAGFFEKHRLTYPHKYMLGEQNENVTGNGINQCRNTFESFDVSDLEDCKNCTWLHKSKNCMDIYAWGFPAEECYECTEVGDRSYHSYFCITTYNATNIMYSYCTNSCQDVFGCVSLRNKKYCVLNRQYTKEEYEALVPKIIEHMRSTGEWGEFLPMSASPLAYNQTVAQDYIPITKEKAKKLGAKWADEPPEKPLSEKVEIPDSILDTDENICDKILVCEKTGKQYKIIPQEFKFYKENNIPIPIYCPEVRHKNRLAKRNPRKLWDRNCAKCGVDIKTSYSPDRPETVYCENCYLKNIY
jgi:hypothetical protein